MSARSIDDLAAAFRACELPKAEWTHLAHLRVGAWHVHHFGPERALEMLRTGIRRLNERHGTANTPTSGYHETITVGLSILAYRSLLPRPDSISSKPFA